MTLKTENEKVMTQLTDQEYEANMMSFDEQMPCVGISERRVKLGSTIPSRDRGRRSQDHWDIGHGWSGDMPK